MFAYVVIMGLKRRLSEPYFLIFLLVISTVCQARVIHRESVNGFKFNSVEKFYRGILKDSRGDNYVFNCMMYDDYVKGNVIFAKSHSIYTMNLRTYVIHHIAGKNSSGYSEGHGHAALFNFIDSMATSPIDYPNNILVADQSNSCIRSLNRETNITSHFAGQCTKVGEADGASTAAMMGHVRGLIKNPKNRKEYHVFDFTYKKLKKISQSSSATQWTVQTMAVWSHGIMMAMAYHPQGNDIYITGMTGVWKYSVRTSSYDVVFNGKSGHNDGPLGTAQINTAFSIAFLSNNVFVIVDSFNNILRVVDLLTGEISSVCEKKTVAEKTTFGRGSIANCTLKSVIFIMNHHRESKILINGENIYALSYTDLRTTPIETTTTEMYIKTTATSTTTKSSTAASSAIKSTTSRYTSVFTEGQLKTTTTSTTTKSSMAASSAIKSTTSRYTSVFTERQMNSTVIASVPMNTTSTEELTILAQVATMLKSEMTLSVIVIGTVVALVGIIIGVAFLRNRGSNTTASGGPNHLGYRSPSRLLLESVSQPKLTGTKAPATGAPNHMGYRTPSRLLLQSGQQPRATASTMLGQQDVQNRVGKRKMRSNTGLAGKRSNLNRRF